MYESPNGAANSETFLAERDARFEELLERTLQVLRHRPAALVTDVDGTISPIERHPQMAAVLPLARDALKRLRDELALVAVVSGRSAADARRMVRLSGIAYVGNHGLEFSVGERAFTLPEVEPWIPRIQETVTIASSRITEPGVVFEDKGATASVHYRLAAEPAVARCTILDTLATIPEMRGLRIEEGRMVINLLPPLRVTKGSAVRWLARENHLKGIVYFGDDVTDGHAFESLSKMRAEGAAETLSIAVSSPQTPTAVRRHADDEVHSVAEAAKLLDGLARALHRPRGHLAPESRATMA